MQTKKCFMSWAASFVVILALSYFWHRVLMSLFYEMYAPSNARYEPSMGWIFAGIAVLTALMAYMYPKGYEGGSPLKEGLKFGLLIGLLWRLPYGLIELGVFEIPPIGFFVDAAWHLVEEGIGGIVIGFIYGRSSASSV